jgi:hypothetical protein
MSNQNLNRRFFLQSGGAALSLHAARGAGRNVSIVREPSDAVAASAPAQWAASELRAALEAAGNQVMMRERIGDAAAGDLCIVAASGGPAATEALFIGAARRQGRDVLLASGHDTRGLTYALLELADRARHGSPLETPANERPQNPVRAISRLFTSDVEDLGWYHDRDMWREYLTMLATHRFNRFHLAFGIGYDFLREVTDAYFLFPYPFFMDVAGYKVRVPQLSNADRDRNMETLRFISEQTAARGLDFQLGLWMHGYEWINSPHPNFTIEGVTKQNHGPYCRDAVRAMLKALPAVSGVTFRVHGESGVEEGSYEFWRTVFEGVAKCGRTVEIDMHSKGMDQTMLDMAVATGQPVRLSPKYWAEHMGMTYHQADIRDLEVPKAGKQASALMKFSAGSRSFLRYGYGDLLREDRKWGVIHRIWPGTQRLLLWGDPLTAAAHSRAFGFAGSDGVDIMEPLSFKGRRGSGIAGGRCAYADASLSPKWDWQKYEYSYRVWGRLVYNPQADAGAWRRDLRKTFGGGALDAEQALGNASRILPIVTTTHGTSAGNNMYWPEIYLNQSLVEDTGVYSDTPVPKVFGTVSPLDPQLFSRINDYADGLLKGERDAKYSPIEVAVWLEDYTAAAQKHLAQLETKASGKDRPEYRRFVIDTAMEAGLGRFFAAKFRAGVLYRIHEQSGARKALEEALRAYRAAREAWAQVAAAGKVYKSDITIGERPALHGHWADRLPAIDTDIARVAKKLESAKAGEPDARAAAAIKEALGRPRRPVLACTHRPGTHFTPGKPVRIEIAIDRKAASARLLYRHVTQAERYQSVAMAESNNRHTAEIPAGYADGGYPIQYYFEVRDDAGNAWLYPGLGENLTNQPYFVLRRGRT